MSKYIPFSRIAKINHGLGYYSEQNWHTWESAPLHNGQLALLVLDGLLCALHLGNDDIIKSNDDAYDIADNLGFLK